MTHGMHGVHGMSLLLIAVGGALGALARYAIAIGAIKHLGDDWPWGTLIANLVGCLALGLLTPLVTRPGLEGLRLFAAVGLLGSLTTFSTLCFELVLLLHSRSFGAALGYAVASLAGGILLAALGWWICQRLAGP